jgi:hypothetical protein
MPDHQPPSPATVNQPSPEEADWLREREELPPRPRRPVLAPLPLALMAILLLAGGFIGGVLVQKGQSSTSGTGGATLPSRLAALRGTTSSTGGATGSASGQSAGPPGGAAAGSRSADAATTVGQVAFVKGSTLYVTDTQGNTVKVKASASATVSKTVSSSVRAIHPGETVLVTGTTDANGAVTAQAIRVGTGATSGLGALFSSGASRRTAPGSGETGEPALFGKG